MDSGPLARLVAFVATPLLVIPIFAAAQARWSAQDIFLFVGAFGAMGHHLPGMIRAYSDRALFNRFKMRFVVAPVLLLIVCIGSAFYNVQAVQLVALGWGIWHGMMQTYGFSRIYDAKASATAAERARADLALCFAWFVGGGVALSDALSELPGSLLRKRWAARAGLRYLGYPRGSGRSTCARDGSFRLAPMERLAAGPRGERR
ncbi:MAG: hypothetical protein H0W04_09250 [Chthoniobacterales bacterium]|nr:hypothetical protein [Chthoniobacterales bacterium]